MASRIENVINAGQHILNTLSSTFHEFIILILYIGISALLENP